MFQVSQCVNLYNIMLTDQYKLEYRHILLHSALITGRYSARCFRADLQQLYYSTKPFVMYMIDKLLYKDNKMCNMTLYISLRTRTQHSSLLSTCVTVISNNYFLTFSFEIIHGLTGTLISELVSHYPYPAWAADWLMNDYIFVSLRAKKQSNNSVQNILRAGNFSSQY